jgi:GT2 family glycosyltransferase
MADGASTSPAGPPDRSVSILIVNYRTYDELTACLASLQPFVNRDDEIIVVDHETDVARCRQLEQRFPAVNLLAIRDNPGFAAGINQAARVASGRFLLVLNPDCLVSTDIIGGLTATLERDRRAGVCGAQIREADGSLQASARTFPTVTTGFAGRTSWLTRVWPDNPWTRRNLGATDAHAPAREVDWVSGACMMIRREAFAAVDGLDEGFFMYWEDADFCYRLKQAGWTTIYDPAVRLTHLTGRSSGQAARPALIAFHRSAYRYFRKHGGAARWLAPLVLLALELRLMLKLAGLRAARASTKSG